MPKGWSIANLKIELVQLFQISTDRLGTKSGDVANFVQLSCHCSIRTKIGAWLSTKNGENIIISD